LNVYGASKAEGESRIMQAPGDHLIIRVSALYGNQPCRAKSGLNFVQLMLKLASEKGSVKVVQDETVTPTYTLDIARLIPSVLHTPVRGIIHIASAGCCTWYDFAQEIFSYTNTPVRLDPAMTADFVQKTTRPAFSALGSSVRDTIPHAIMPHWKEALHAYLDTLQKN
jgi:dTDP-4-dehydrorhamnose reductase